MSGLNTRELTTETLEHVSGGTKGDSGGLRAAQSIDLSKFLAQLDRAIAKAKQI